MGNSKKDETVTIKAGANEFRVQLKTYEVIGDRSVPEDYALEIHAYLVGKNPDPVIKLSFPVPPDTIVMSIQKLGTQGLVGATIDFNTKRVYVKRDAGNMPAGANSGVNRSNQHAPAFRG